MPSEHSRCAASPNGRNKIHQTALIGEFLVRIEIRVSRLHQRVVQQAIGREERGRGAHQCEFLQLVKDFHDRLR